MEDSSTRRVLSPGSPHCVAKIQKKLQLERGREENLSLELPLLPPPAHLFLFSATGYAGQVGLKLADPFLKWVV